MIRTLILATNAEVAGIVATIGVAIWHALSPRLSASPAPGTTTTTTNTGTTP